MCDLMYSYVVLGQFNKSIFVFINLSINHFKGMFMVNINFGVCVVLVSVLLGGS